MVCLKKGSFGQLPIKTPPKKGSFGQHTHGFGTKSMRNVVNSYGGQLRFFEQENMFTMVAMLPIPQTQQGTATIKV